MHSSESHILKPNSWCDGIWRCSIGEVIGHESGSLVNGTGALIEENPEGPLTPPTTWGHGKNTLNQELGPRTTPNVLAPWSQTSQSPELWEINVYKPPSLSYFVIAAWMYWNSMNIIFVLFYSEFNPYGWVAFILSVYWKVCMLKGLSLSKILHECISSNVILLS